MTDRAAAKRKERARKSAGYKFLSGYADAAAAPEIESKLLFAEEVDKRIAEKEERNDGCDS